MTNPYLSGLALFGLLAIGLSACGDEAARDAVPDPMEAPAPAERLAVPTDAARAAAEPALPRAAVTDTLGTFEGEVFGLALWEHPIISFGGAVLAANGAAGLAVVPVDRQVEGAVVEGAFDGPVAVGYTEEASYVAAASGNEVMLYTVGPDRTFTPVGTVAGDAQALCLIGDTLLVVAAEATAYRIGAEGTAEALYTRPAAPGAMCAATADRFFIASPGGPLRSFDAAGGDALVDDAYAGVPVGGFAALATPEGPALVYQSRGVFHVDGPGMAHTAVRLVRDGDGAAAGPVVAAGSGNFGSIYRDGVVALLSGSDLVLLPWAGIARAAGLDGVETASLRPRPEVSPLAPEIDLQLPELPSGAGTTLAPTEAE